MKYEFKDTFIKTCTDGICKKNRESYKCIDNKCEKVDYTNNKKEILVDYYSGLKRDMQKGSGKYIFKCKICNFKSSRFEKYKNI